MANIIVGLKMKKYVIIYDKNKIWVLYLVLPSIFISAKEAIQRIMDTCPKTFKYATKCDIRLQRTYSYTDFSTKIW